MRQLGLGDYQGQRNPLPEIFPGAIIPVRIPPPPPPGLVDLHSRKGKGSVSDRPIGAASCRQRNQPWRHANPRCTHQRAHGGAGVGKRGMDSECGSGCPWSTAQVTAHLWDSRPRSSQTVQVIQGSVATTKTHSDPQRVRVCKGERPIGAAKAKQTDTMASCPTPPLQWTVELGPVVLGMVPKDGPGTAVHSCGGCWWAGLPTTASKEDTPPWTEC